MSSHENAARSEAQDLAERYLTTKQVAALLHVKERKIYELASSGEIPGTRALGKWLFDRDAINSWLADHATDQTPQRDAVPANVVLGSYDPLLEWAMRESRSGLASFLDGSLDGLERFGRREGIISGLHLFDAETADWNVPVVRRRLAEDAAVLVEWAWRERGLMVPPGNPSNVASVSDLAGKRVTPRQQGAGSQVLLEHYLQANEIDMNSLTLAKPARSESDAALAVMEGEADVAFGLRCVARQFRLDFVPVIKERFDLLVWRREWFEPPFQNLLQFTTTPAFRDRAEVLTGYDISALGRVRFNGR